LDVLTGPQLSEWEAMDSIDPIGKWRDDFIGAKIESLIVNIVQQLYAKQGSTPVITTPADFMPDWLGERKIEPKKQSTEDMKQMLLSFAKRQNKRIDSLKNTTTDRPPTKFKGR
jgi:hypothetical protein